MRFFVIFVPLLLASAMLTAAETSDYLATYREALKRNGISPTPDGAVGYLLELQPNENRRERVQSLIRQLGADSYVDREAATSQLLRLPAAPVEMLAEAMRGDDAEVRWRAKLILDRSENQTSHLLLAALKVLASSPPADCTSDILAVAASCRQPYLADALAEALHAAAGPNDVDALRAKLGDPDEYVRVAAAIALAGVLEPGNLAELYPLLDDANELIAIKVARTIADQGDRRCLPTLVRLLQSPDAAIRSESGFILAALTDRQMGFAPYDPPEKRAPAVAAWKQWLAAEGSTAELTFPIQRRRSARGDLQGNTLISTGSKNQVLELDPAGKIIWSYPLNSWSAEKLPNGNVLIASYTEKKVVEVDSVGNVVWEFGGVTAMSAKPLLNGNILVADFSGRRVIEVNRNKNIVWEHATTNECFDADRLPNGNTIFGCPNLVCEVMPDGQTVNEWKISGRLNGFQALDNGHLLIANYGEGKVTELTRDGQVVFEFAETQPCDVYRLPSGRMLVTTAARVIEVGPDKKVIRELTKAQYGSARQ